MMQYDNQVKGQGQLICFILQYMCYLIFFVGEQGNGVFDGQQSFGDLDQ